uniref:Calmodulin-binding domain-containing protein n=1 Tax=Rhizophora mucronata TaxID=61149 RepID=A0A2P2JIK0_RHIMU
MTPGVLETEAESDCSTASESSSMATESSSSSSSRHQSQDTNGNMGGAEPKRKVKKLRSIKLTRLPSLKLPTRQQAKVPSNCLTVSSSFAPTSPRSAPTEMPDASPSYMKTTTSSDAKKGTLQKSARTLSRRSSFKPAKRLARLSSKKLRRPLMRKSSGGNGLLKKSRSVRRANWDASPNYLEETSCSGPSNARFQASLFNSKSGITSSDENTKDSINIKPKLSSSDNKSIRAKNVTSTLRPSKVLTKMASLKTKRSSVKNCFQVPDCSINKATCSSALKDSKLPDRLELELGGSESMRPPISSMKVCPYSYCSLHGHNHSDPRSVKHFVPMRRRLLKAHMNMKFESQEKHTSNNKKGTQTSQTASYAGPAILEAAQDSREISQTRKIARPKSDLNGGTHGDDEGSSYSASVDEAMLDEVSHGEIDKQISEFPAGEKSPRVTCLTQSEANMECHSISTGEDKLISKCMIAGMNEEELIESSSYSGKQKLVLTVDQSDFTTFSTPQQKDPRAYDELPFKFTKSTCHEEVPLRTKVQQEVNGNTMPLDLCKDDLESSIMEASTTSVPLEEQSAIHGKENHNSADSEHDCSADLANKTQMDKQKHMGLWHLVYHHMVSGTATEDDTLPQLDKVEKNVEGEDAITYPVMESPGFSWDYSSADESKVVAAPDEGSQKFQLYKHNAIRLVQEALDKILSEIPDQSSDDQSVTSARNSDEQLSENDHGKDGELTISTSFDSSRDSALCEAAAANFKNDFTDRGEKSETNVREKPNQGTPKSWSNLRKIITLNRFLKTLEKVKDFNPRKPRYLPSEHDPEAEKVQLRHQTVLGRKNSEEWMLDYALQKVISTLAPAQKRKVALLVQAFETVIPPPEIGTHSMFNATISSQTTPVQCSSGSSNGQDSGRGTAGIFLCKTSCLDMSFKENQDQISDSSTTEWHIAPDLKETSPASRHAQRELGTPAPETPARQSKEEVAAFKFDHGSDNSIVKDERSKIINNSSVKLVKPELCDKPPPRQVEDLETSCEESPINGKILLKAPEQAGLFSASEVHDHDFKVHKEKLNSDNQIQGTDGQSDDPNVQIPDDSEESISNNEVTSLPFISEQLEEPSEVNEAKMKIRNKLIQAFNPPEDSESSWTTGTAHEKQTERQKHMQFWYFVYEHMLSGTATVLEESDKEEQGDDANLKIVMKNAYSDLGPPEINQDINIEHHPVSSRKVELQQIEAIRLVEEAIDEIPLTEIQDDSCDDRSIASDLVPDQEDLERAPTEEEELFPSTSICCTTVSFGESNDTEVKDGAVLGTKETWVNSDNMADQQKPETVAGNSCKLPRQKRWGHLKKMILLRRFINALEKVEKFNPGKPQFLPLDPGRDAEKVNLRHQDMGDRKNADEWMLDCALQQVVSKLTPVRKRKVKLLVEAFETVIPTVRS